MSETIADIVREMRRSVDRHERGDEYYIATDSVRVWADRIEAAWANECAGCRLLVEDRRRIDELIAERNGLAEKNRICRDENARLRAALKPVLECDVEEKYDGNPFDCMDHNDRIDVMARRAVREAQRIYKEEKE